MSVLGKMTIGFRSNLVANFDKKLQFVLEVLFFFIVCLTGKSKNLAKRQFSRILSFL